MSELYKNVRQIEFAELMERMTEAGYNDAEVARLLHVSRATVSKINAGKQSPRDNLLALFRSVATASLTPGVEPPGATSLKEQLEFLKANAPESYEVAKVTIDALHKTAVRTVKPTEPTKPPSSAKEGEVVMPVPPDQAYTAGYASGPKRPPARLRNKDAKAS